MTTKLKGTHPWLVILCCPSDRDVPSWPDRDYFTSFISGAGAGGLFDFWSQISGQRLDLTGSRVLGWYRLIQTVAQINAMSRSGAAAVARAAATAAGEDVSGYRYTLAVLLGTGHFGNQNADVVTGLLGIRGQPFWRWCNKCECLAFWDGTRQPGPCPAGGRHDHTQGSSYAVERDTTIVDGQPGWKWCNKCETLVISTLPAAPCSGRGNHTFEGSGTYVIRMGSTGPGEQHDWKWCRRCNCLGIWDGTREPGHCPAGGRHDYSGSGNYSVPMAWTASVGALGHESGHSFGLPHSFGSSRDGNYGNDSRPGAYDDWTDLMSWANTAQNHCPYNRSRSSGSV